MSYERHRDLFAGQDAEMTASLPTRLASKVQDTIPDTDEHGASSTPAECCAEQPHLQTFCEEERNLAGMKGEAVPAMRGSVKGWTGRQSKQSERKGRKMGVKGRGAEEQGKRGGSKL